jgi:hypothetical protein
MGDTGVARVTPLTQDASLRKPVCNNALHAFSGDAPVALTRQMGHDQDVEVQN